MPRPDLKFTIPLVESSWCEMADLIKLLVAFISILPVSYLLLILEFETLLKEISQYEIYILGDFNVDRLLDELE